MICEMIHSCIILGSRLTGIEFVFVLYFVTLQLFIMFNSLISVFLRELDIRSGVNLVWILTYTVIFFSGLEILNIMLLFIILETFLNSVFLELFLP